MRHILLADDAPVRNNNHRTGIQCDGPDAEPITCEMLCNLVRDHRPQWVLDDIAAREKSCDSGRLRDRIQELARKLRAYTPLPLAAPEGDELGVLARQDEGQGGGDWRPDARVGPRERRRGKPLPRPCLEPLFARLQLPREEHLGWYEDVGGTAGRYDKHANMIWLSVDFDEYRRLRDWIDQAWPDPEAHALALACLDEEYCDFAASFGLAALSFHGEEGWRLEQWEECLKPEALSAHMRDPDGLIQARIKNQVNSRLNAQIRGRAAEGSHA